MKSPSPKIYDIPSSENARKIIEDLGLAGSSPALIREWFKIHEQGQYNRRSKKTPTKKVKIKLRIIDILKCALHKKRF